MSRIGKKPVAVPSGVKVEVAGRTVKVEGPKGKLAIEHHPSVGVSTKESGVEIQPIRSDRLARALHGTTRQLIQNMVLGVTNGFEKKLAIVGVGYNAKAQDKKLTLNIGFCHPVEFEVPEGLSVETPTNTSITISGVDKQLVGQFAANVRRMRPPEPYKGKGIMYEGEQIIRKAAKGLGSS